MKKSIIYKGVIFLTAVMIFWGCKKDEESVADPPGISVLIPAKGSSYQVLDTIFVKADIVHNKVITEVSVSVIDKLNNPVTRVIKVYPAQNSYTLEQYLVISNDKLPTCTYEILVRASDGIAASASYVEIFINGIPVRFRQIWAITQQNDLKTYIVRYDSLYNKINTSTITGNFRNSALNSQTGQFFFADSTTASLTAYSPDSLEVIWDKSFVTPHPVSFSMDTYESLLYVATSGGIIHGYNPQGITMMQTPFNEDRIPAEIFRSEKYIVSWQTSRSSYDKYLVGYYAATGAHAGERMTFLDVVGFGEKNPDEMYVFGNGNDTAWILGYNVLTNQEYPVNYLAATEFTDIDRLDDDKYILASDKGIYEFRSSTGILSKVIPATAIQIVRYDPNNSVLYAADVEKIRVFDYETGGLINTLKPGYSIRNIHIRYNR